jgi:phage/plasmid-associated DNA primase
LAFKTNGKVNDCEQVLSASRNYRKTQDVISGFISECTILTEKKTDIIKKTALVNRFKEWYRNEQGGGGNGPGSKKLPKAQEIYDAMSKKYKFHRNIHWVQCVFVSEDVIDPDADVEEEK